MAVNNFYYFLSVLWIRVRSVTSMDSANDCSISEDNSGFWSSWRAMKSMGFRMRKNGANASSVHTFIHKYLRNHDRTFIRTLTCVKVSMKWRYKVNSTKSFLIMRTQHTNNISRDILSVSSLSTVDLPWEAPYHKIYKYSLVEPPLNQLQGPPYPPHSQNG